MNKQTIILLTSYFSIAHVQVTTLSGSACTSLAPRAERRGVGAGRGRGEHCCGHRRGAGATQAPAAGSGARARARAGSGIRGPTAIPAVGHGVGGLGLLARSPGSALAGAVALALLGPRFAVRVAARGDDFRAARPCDVFGREFAVVALGHFELDLLALRQAAEAFRLDRGLVYEHVLAAVARRDEAEAFVLFEPQHFTSLLARIHKYYIVF